MASHILTGDTPSFPRQLILETVSQPSNLQTRVEAEQLLHYLVSGERYSDHGYGSQIIDADSSVQSSQDSIFMIYQAYCLRHAHTADVKKNHLNVYLA